MSRLLDRRNAKRINGLRRDPRTGAGKLAKGERGYGGVLALDFTDNSASVYDPTTQANVAYSQGVTDGNGNFRGVSSLLTYTSPSNKLTLQSDGYIKYQAHNLVLQSEDFSTTWTGVQMLAFGSGSTVNATTAPDGTTTADLLTPNTTNATHYMVASAVTLASQVGHHSVYVKPNGYTKIGLKEGSTTGEYATFNLSGSGSVIANTSDDASISYDSSNGWYRVTMTVATASSQQMRIFILGPGYTTGDPNSVGAFAGDGASGVYLWGAHVRNNNAATDYIRTSASAVYALPLEYSATDGSCLGLLVEEARTNLCLYSNDLTQVGSWTASNMTTAKTATGPDNVANSATTITASAGNATILQAITSASAARVTSVYIKRRTGTGNIDLTQDNGSTWTTQAVDSTWTRFSLSSVTSANPTVGIRIVTSGDAVDVALFSHEVGAFVTSPILTYGATATRNADPLSQLTSTFPLSATAGSFYAYVAPYAGADLAGIVSLNDGTGNEEIVIYKDASANIVAQVEDGGVNQLAPLDSTVNASSGTAFKVALVWAANDFALSVDGTAVQTDTGGTLPTVTTLEIGVDQANNYFNGHIKAISYVPRRKSNAELQAETA